MELAVLGRLEVRIDGELAPLGGPKQRLLLALLLLSANDVVSRDHLVDALWGERAPASAQRSLDSYVSRLRALLGSDRIERRPPGYLFRVTPGELDLERFERLLDEARSAAAGGDATMQSDRLREALGIWRGHALADLLDEPSAAAAAERLEELRALALEERIDADLALGQGSELVPELERLVADQPFRERPIGLLMLALYRAARQAEALAVYQEFRHRLAGELGLKPGTQLRDLEQRILRQDPELLGAGTIGPTSRSPRRRWRLAAALTLGAVAASAAVGILVGTRGTSASVGQLVALRLATGAPSALISAYGHLWTANPNRGTVSRVDTATRSVGDEIQVPGSPAALAAGGGGIWTTSVPGDRVLRIDPVTGTVTKTVLLDGVTAGGLAFGDGGLWIADLTDNELIELDAVSGAQRRAIPLPVQPTALAISNRTMWVADYNQNRLVEVDLETGQPMTTVHVGTGPGALAITADSVWVACVLDGTVWRINRRTGSVITVIPVGSGPSAIVLAIGSLWVANRYSGTVARIDPNSNTVAKIQVGGEPVGLAAARNKIWEASAQVAQHRGRTLTLLHTHPLGRSITTIDPDLNVDLLPLQADNLTADGLVTYNHAPGAAGTQLVPDLALTLPEPTDGGTTYTFRLRRGISIRYSNGRLVRASDFRRSFERLFSLRDPRAPAAVYFTDIVGARKCNAARAGRCDLSQGIVTNDSSGTVIVHLRTPDPSFLPDLASRPLPPIPPGTPFRAIGFTPIPGTGPYKIVSASKYEVRYARNPYFHEWSHAAQPDGNPDQIVTRFGLSHAAEAREVEAGRADYSTDPIPTRLLSTLKARFPDRLHPATIPTTAFYAINTRLRPFNDVRVRRALNFAIDRRVLVRLYGGPDQAAPTCQILPPEVPGYRRDCPYTRNPDPAGRWTAPDLAKAAQLVAASGTRGTAITISDSSDGGNREADVYVARVLRRLGYRASLRLAPQAYFEGHPGVFNHIQLHQAAWGDTPYGYFGSWFACGGQFNHGWFCDRRLASENSRAESLNATNPRAAATVWATIDHRLVAQAAWLPLVDLRGIDFVSARVRNYQFHPYSGIIADQLWLR